MSLGPDFRVSNSQLRLLRKGQGSPRKELHAGAVRLQAEAYAHACSPTCISFLKEKVRPVAQPCVWSSLPHLNPGSTGLQLISKHLLETLK